MKNKVIALSLAVFMAVTSVACHDGSAAEADKQVSQANLNIELGLEDGEAISMLSPKMSEYLALDSDKTEEIAKFLYNAETGWYYENLSTLSWADVGAASYDVWFSANENMEAPYIVETDGTEINISDCSFLIPGKTYYWKVIGVNAEGNGAFSETRSFTVKDETVRTVYVDGVDNVRDIGGWEAADGMRVKYGMLYRGGRLNPNPATEKEYLTQKGVETMNQLGIRAEIDLRNSGDNDGQIDAVFGNDADYHMWSMVGYRHMMKDSQSKTSIKKIFEYLAEEDNYPIYFHCNYGADRTGTLAFLINGLLGVEYENLVKDFELTSLSPSEARWRSGIKYDSEKETYSFQKNGVMQSDESNFVAFDDMYHRIMKTYGKDSSLAEAIEKYLEKDCGVSQKTIDSIRDILLEEM